MASLGYFKRRGTPEDPSELKSRELLGFSKPEPLNYWPLQNRDGNSVHIRPTFSATSGEALRLLAANGRGLTCLSEFSTDADLKSGRLVEILAAKNTGASQSVYAVFYRNFAHSARISSFIVFLEEELRNQLAFISHMQSHNTQLAKQTR